MNVRAERLSTLGGRAFRLATATPLCGVALTVNKARPLCRGPQQAPMLRLLGRSAEGQRAAPGVGTERYINMDKLIYDELTLCSVAACSGLHIQNDTPGPII